MQKIITIILTFILSFGLCLGQVMAQANSILPNVASDTGPVEISTCAELKRLYTKAKQGASDSPSLGQLDGQYLGLKLRCGSMQLGDILHYVKFFLEFVFNILGTLAVIAVMRAGYIFMFSKDKDSATGKKALQQVIIGVAVAVFSFTIVRLAFTFFLSFGG